MDRSPSYAFHELDVHGHRVAGSDHQAVDYETLKDHSLHHPTYISSAYIISYILLAFALTFGITAAVAYKASYEEAAGNPITNITSLGLHDGTCDEGLHTYGLVAHFFINVLGTIILASSNYLQQITTSPGIVDIAVQMRTRGDVYFGANSPSNVFRQGGTLLYLWLWLILTSVPIHLTLNGIVGYAVFPFPPKGQAVLASQNLSISAAGNWSMITPDECIQDLYSALVYITDYDNITVVVKNSSLLENYQYAIEALTAEGFTFNANDLETCYVHLVESKCELTIRWLPLLCTAVAVAGKSVVAFIAVRWHPHFRRRVFNSLGDMIAVGARYPRFRAHSSKVSYGQRTIRWLEALGCWDFSTLMFWWASVLGVTICGGLLWVQKSVGLSSAERMKRLGVGTIDPLTSFTPGYGGPIDSNRGRHTAVIQLFIANSPQLWLSFGYLLWNNQISRIWMEREWRHYYCRRHKPRVSYSSKEMGVRATRWLQLPYWLSGTLMLISIVLHWLVSQALFVVEILGDDIALHYSYLNYSPLTIFIVGMMTTILVLGITIHYLWPIKTWMPLMAGSAQVVFASCRYLSPSLPVGGIAWGDLSTRRRGRVGFGETVRPLVIGMYRDSMTYSQPDSFRDTSQSVDGATHDVERWRS